MSKMHVIAKAVLAGLGVLAVFSVLDFISIAVPGEIVRLRCGIPRTVSVVNILILTATTLAFGVVFFRLIFRSDRWAERIVGCRKNCEPMSDASWVVIVFRFAAVLCGLIITWRSLPAIVAVVSFSPQLREVIRDMTYGIFPTIPLTALCKAVFELICLVSGLYLLSGAPHFVRWQMEKLAASEPFRSQAEQLPE